MRVLTADFEYYHQARKRLAPNRNAPVPRKLSFRNRAGSSPFGKSPDCITDAPGPPEANQQLGS
ncbi:MAG: hypothetical protein ACE5I3_05405 [Phycisphaerae bacterium]